MMDGPLLAAARGLLGGLLLLDWPDVVMIAVGCGLMYLGIARGFEPLLLLPIGFGAALVNIPGAHLMEPGGVLRTVYDAGVANELFPVLIFIGIGAMIDFGPLLENPKTLLLGAAGQTGIFIVLLAALLLGFRPNEAISIGVIGAMDGPTAIFVTAQHAPHLLGAVSVAAYSYMALVPLIQPPLMRWLTSEQERVIPMPAAMPTVSRRVRLLFPVIVFLLGALVAPQGAPLLGAIMLGNLMRESGVVERLADAAANELTNVVTLLLGLAIGATMEASRFLNAQTLLVLALGFGAICLDTVAGILLGKLMCFLSRGKINPLIGTAGISAFPMAARVVQREGQRYNRRNYLLMHAMGANTGGQLGSVMAAAIMLSVAASLGVV